MTTREPEVSGLETARIVITRTLTPDDNDVHGVEATRRRGRPVTTHVLRTPMRETHRTPNPEPRWCFRERKLTTHAVVARATVEPSCYGPTLTIECDSCRQPDADLFPGRARDWDDQ